MNSQSIGSMKPAQCQKQCQSYLEDLLRNMLVHMMLTHYNVEIRYEKGLKSSMEIDIDHEYLEADIVYGKKIVKSLDEGKSKLVQATLVHEITHILTSRLTEGRKGLSKRRFLELEESVNEHLSKIILKGVLK